MLDDRSADMTKGIGIEGVLGLISLTILLLGAVIWSAHGPRAEKTDFAFTYMGATIVHQGNAARLYDRGFQTRTRESLFSDPNPLLFEHPPFEALLLSPMARYSFRTAYLLWGILNVVVLVLTIFALRPYCHWPKQDLAYCCLWPLFAPLGIALFQGQTSILVLAFISAGFVMLRKFREFPAGVCFGLALFKPQIVVPLMLIFLLRRRWAVIAGGIVTGTILGVLSIRAVGIRGLEQYGRFLVNVSRTPRDLSSGSAVDMGSIHGLLFALLGRLFHPSAIIVISIGLSVLLIWFVAKRWSELQDSNVGFAASLAATLVAGDHVFAHDFSPFILALFLAAGNLFATRESPAQRGLNYLLVFFWCFPIYFVLVAGHCLFLLAPFLVLFAILVLNMKINTDRTVPTKSALAGVR